MAISLSKHNHFVVHIKAGGNLIYFTHYVLKTLLHLHIIYEIKKENTWFSYRFLALFYTII